MNKIIRCTLLRATSSAALPIRSYSTTSDPCSSGIHKKKNPLSFVDSVKTTFSPQLEILNEKICSLNEDRNPPKTNFDVVNFFNKLSGAVLTDSAKFVLVGSAVNGLAHKSSDYDLVFFPTSSPQRSQFLRDFHTNQSFKNHFMNVFTKLIKRECMRFGQKVETLALKWTRVPLLVVQFENGISVDIQFPEQNFHAIRNTHLIRCYSQCDVRFSQLFSWVRTICDALEIRNSKQGLLSSYHLILLVVHFLQSEQSLSPWPVLPVLMKTAPQFVAPDVPIDHVVKSIQGASPIIPWSSHNTMSVAELAVRYVDYYSQFNFSKDAIYIAKGLTSRRKQTFGAAQIQLIDPYSPVSVCRTHYSTNAFIAAMGFMRSKMKRGLMLDTFPELPEADLFKREVQFSTWKTQTNDKLK